MTEKIHHQISLKYSSKFKEGTPRTNLVMMMGFKNAHNVIKDRLRHFMKLEHLCRPIDFRFQATIDNLLELLWQLHLTPTHFKRHSPDTKQLNKNRKQTVCELCGNRNELAEYFYKLDNNLLEPEDEIEKHNEENPDNKKKRQLSHRYCSHHRPKSKDGLTWNSTYKSAIKSKDLFEKEYRRLQLHIVKVEKLKAVSEDKLVNLYFYHVLQDKSVTQKQADTFFHCVSGNFKYPIEINGETAKLISEVGIRLTGSATTFDPSDDKALRNIARKMVDSRLTDNKKKMLTLRKQGLSQKEIANKLTELSG